MSYKRFGKRVFDGFVKVWAVRPPWHKPNFDLLVVESTDSVGIILLHIDNHGSPRLLVTEQSRASMMSEKEPLGKIIEIPAGRFDTPASVIQLVQKEALEETGVVLKPKDIKIISQPLALSPGVLSEKMTFAFAVIDEAKTGQFGNKEEGEDIKTFFLPLDMILNYTRDAKTFLAAAYAKLYMADLVK